MGCESPCAIHSDRALPSTAVYDISPPRRPDLPRPPCSHACPMRIYSKRPKSCPNCGAKNLPAHRHCPAPVWKRTSFPQTCHSMLSVMKESWKPLQGIRTARDADLSSAEAEFPTASAGLPSAARWMLPPRPGPAASVWTSDSGHQGPTALCCLNRVEGGSSRTHSHQKGCPGAATIVSNGQARLGSWAGHTWTRSSVPYVRTPPPTHPGPHSSLPQTSACCLPSLSGPILHQADGGLRTSLSWP